MKFLNDKWEKYGLEPDSNAAKIAGQNCFIKNMSFEEDVYPENHFDIINMHHVIEHIDNPLKTMKEIKKILKPNGKLIIATGSCLVWQILPNNDYQKLSKFLASI